MAGDNHISESMVGDGGRPSQQSQTFLDAYRARATPFIAHHALALFGVSIDKLSRTHTQRLSLPSRDSRRPMMIKLIGVLPKEALVAAVGPSVNL